MAYRPTFQYAMNYLSWYNSPHADQFLSQQTCSSNFSHQFLATVSKKERDGFRTTALFCEASYWKQQVQVTLPSNTFRPINASITPLGPVEELPITEFNNTGFEYLIGSSVSEVQSVARDYPNNLIVDQYAKVNGTGLNWPLSPLVGFVIGGRERPVDDYLDETLLAEGFRAVQKSAFVQAYSRLLSEAAASNNTIDGSAEFILYGILVSRLFSALVEGLLLAVGISAIILAVLAGRKESKLIRDPASLGDIMDLLQASPDLLDAAILEENFTEDDARHEMESTRVYLQHTCHDPTGTMAIRILNPNGSPRALLGPGATCNLEADSYTPATPFILRRTSGALLMILTIGCLVALVYFRIREQRLGG